MSALEVYIKSSRLGKRNELDKHLKLEEFEKFDINQKNIII